MPPDASFSRRCRRRRVLGDFHAEDEDSTIPLAWVEAAVERWHAWDEDGRGDLGGPHTVGVDVARLGDDKTVLAVRHGPVLVELRRSVKEDTMQTTGRLTGVLHGDLQSTAIVDLSAVTAATWTQLGATFRGYRLRHGWSFRQAARVVGVSPGTIRFLEIGQRAPSVVVAEQLIDRYKMSLDDANALRDAALEGVGKDWYPRQGPHPQRY